MKNTSDDAYWDFERTLGHVLVKREYVQLVNDLPSGVLLSQIVYWHRPTKQGKSKLGVSKQGRMWIAKSREDWCLECCISLKQYTRAIKMLEELGLIETRLFLFNGKTCPHVWLNKAALAKSVGYAEWEQLDVPKGAGLLVPKGISGCSLSSQPYKEEITEENTEESTTAAADASPGAGSLKSSVIQGNFKKNNPKIKSSDKDTMISTWKKFQSMEAGTSFSKPLTAKEVGQLKHVLKSAGELLAMQALNFALGNWEKFSCQVHASKGVSAAQYMNVGFFCMHYEVALQLIADEKAPKRGMASLAHGSSGPVAMPTITVKIEDPVADEAQTLELLATLAALRKNA